MTVPQFPPPRTNPFDPPHALTESLAGGELPKVTLWNGRRVWLVTRHDDARAVLADPRFSVSMDRGVPPLTRAQAFPRHRNAMSRTDGPRHVELRRMVAHEFTPQRVDELVPSIRRIVSTQLDDLLARTPPVDLRDAFALSVPSRLICEILGVPVTDQEYFQEITCNAKARGLTDDQNTAAQRAMYDYCDALVAAKEHAHTDDLVGRLVAGPLRTGHLSREELLTMVKVLINAGHETTANMICLGTLTMLLRPEWLDVMRESPEAVLDAVDELMRYHTIVHDGAPRVATEDVVVGRTRIACHDGVVVSVAAANRDPSVFADPDVPDARRANARRHLAFGHGTHLCLGLWLARAELRVALPALASRIPTLRLAVPVEQISFCEDMQIYGVHDLPVTW